MSLLRFFLFVCLMYFCFIFKPDSLRDSIIYWSASDWLETVHKLFETVKFPPFAMELCVFKECHQTSGSLQSALAYSFCISKLHIHRGQVDSQGPVWSFLCGCTSLSTHIPASKSWGLSGHLWTLLSLSVSLNFPFTFLAGLSISPLPKQYCDFRQLT